MKKKFIFIIIVSSIIGLIGCKKDPVVDDTVIVNYSVLNHSFEEEMNQILDLSWDTFQSDTMYQISENQASDGTKSIEITSFFGGFLSIWQVIPIEGADYRNSFDRQFTELKALSSQDSSGLPKIGDKIELSIDLFVDEATDITNTTPFLVYVESEDVTGKKTIIAESDVQEISKGEWHTLKTIPAANQGVIPDDSVLVVISFQINIPEDGIVFLDNTVFGKRIKADEVPDTIDVTFNGLGSTLLIENQSFETGNPMSSTDDISFSNQAYYGTQSISLDQGQQTSLEIDLTNQTNNYLSAGIWAKSSISEKDASIRLEAYYDQTYHLIGEKSVTKRNVWEYLKTDIPTIDLSGKSIDKIKITIQNETAGLVYFDFLQAGDYQAFNGNPEKLALIAYQPWYASEAEGWGNWKYTDASYFEGGVNSYPSRYIDGKRDIASVYYPVIGAYDSSDREVINYHLDLIKAMNIDVIQVNYYADLNQNMLDALSVIFELAEQKDLKVSILYEPKIHIIGWIPHNTRMDALDAVQDDIKNFIDRYGNSKALLQFDGKPLVELFGVNIIRNSEWNLILEQLFDQGYNPYLMGDSIQNSDYSSMKGMFQWNLYNETLKHGTLFDMKEHINTINSDTLRWANTSIGNNFPIGIVYPGFDDTKVLGWDLGFARKIDLTGPSFYQSAWDQMQTMQSSFNWVLVATFNDWNEGTIIEPEVTWGHQMAIITQKEVAKFKGSGTVDSTLLEAITTQYLNSRTNQYD